MPSFLILYGKSIEELKNGKFLAMQKVQSLTDLVCTLMENSEEFLYAKVSLLLNEGQITIGIANLKDIEDYAWETYEDAIIEAYKEAGCIWQ